MSTFFFLFRILVLCVFICATHFTQIILRTISLIRINAYAVTPVYVNVCDDIKFFHADLNDSIKNTYTNSSHRMVKYSLSQLVYR